MVSIIHQLSYKQIFHVIPFHSSGSGADLSNTTAPFPFPGDPGHPVLDYPEGCVLRPPRSVVTFLTTLVIR